MVTFYSKNKWVGVITSVLLIANIITLVLLWTGHRQDSGAGKFMPPPGAGPAFEFVVQELGMTQQQQDAYRHLRDEHQQQIRPLTDSLAISKKAYFSLLKDSSITDSLLLKFSGKTVQLQQQMELVHFRHFQKLRALCTVDQQQKFDNIIQEILRRFAGPRPPQRNDPPPGRGEMPGPGHP